MKTLYENAVKAAVKAGVITQAQADTILANQNGFGRFGGMYGLEGFGGPGGHGGHGRGGMHGFGDPMAPRPMALPRAVLPPPAFSRAALLPEPACSWIPSLYWYAATSLCEIAAEYQALRLVETPAAVSSFRVRIAGSKLDYLCGHIEIDLLPAPA